MTARLLSEAWIEAAVAEGASIAGPPTLTGAVVVEVTGGPEGDAVAHVVLADGRLASSGPGAVPSPDVTLTLTEADARAVLSGELDLAVAFMQGRMKVVGDMAPVLDLLALFATDDARSLLARVARLTEP